MQQNRCLLVHVVRSTSVISAHRNKWLFWSTALRVHRLCSTSFTWSCGNHAVILCCLFIQDSVVLRFLTALTKKYLYSSHFPLHLSSCQTHSFSTDLVSTVLQSLLWYTNEHLLVQLSGTHTHIFTRFVQCVSVWHACVCVCVKQCN